MTRLREVADAGAEVFVEGRGLRLIDTEGREHLDAIAGLFNVNVGYGRAELADVAGEWLRRLSFGTNFFGRTTPPALELSSKLAAITPPGIERFFFTLGGSDAVDTAIKLVRHHNALAGRPERVKVVARRDSYHGMTLGATSVTGQGALRDRVGPLLPGVVHVEQPHPSDGRASADAIERAIVAEGPETVAAVIGEPVALPPGVVIPADDYWPAVREVCTRHGVLLIADEVVTGFGRTGRMFACEHWGLEPDLIVMSKGLTSGYFPLGAVGMAEAFVGRLTESETILPHGFTAGGHPAACAVALANIEILEREGLVENARERGEQLLNRLTDLVSASPAVAGARALGLLAGLDVAPEAAAPGDDRPAGDWLAATLKARGLLLRNYNGTLAIGPALTATAEDVDEIAERIGEAVAELRR